MMNTDRSRPRRLLEIPIDLLRPHPANPNLMSDADVERLAANICRNHDYPPIVVRAHPTEHGRYEIIDGHQRVRALRTCGETIATCYLWPCDDVAALSLLTTLNRLRGVADPAKLTSLVQELGRLISIEELEILLPNDGAAILADLNHVGDPVADSEASPKLSRRQRRSTVTFLLEPAARTIVEDAVTQASLTKRGRGRRADGLVTIAEAYLKARR